MVLVDTLNIIFIMFHMTNKKLRDEGKEFDEKSKPFFYHMLFQKLNFLFQTYGQLIFCWEGKKSLEWRRSIYPEYKKNRVANDSIQYLKTLFPEIKEILKYYPTKQIEVDEAEADDVIYVLCKKYQGKDITVLTTDKDISQIRNYFPNITIYNPIHRKEIIPSKYIVEEKSIIGDSSDNIPGLYRIGKKTFEKMLENKELFNKKISGENKRIFEAFKKIIDLRKFPKDLQQKIIDKDEQESYNEYKPDEIEDFFYENRMVSMLNRWPVIKGTIKK